MLEFDDIDEWAPKLADALESHIPESVGPKLVAAAPKYIEDARDRLFSLADRDAIIDAALTWARSTTVACYHGTRLTDAEVASVRTMGLSPLKAEARRDRLVDALSPHERWNEAVGGLDDAIQEYGPRRRAGRREGQVHLTLSRFGLTNSFNHYLTHGSEFDQWVAEKLLNSEGLELLRRYGTPRVIQVSVPGTVALDAAHPNFSIDDILRRGGVPNVVDEFLKAWSYRLAYPGFQARTLEVACGMVFRSTVPCDWLVNIKTVPD
jgi:hypothetical protein